MPGNLFDDRVLVCPACRSRVKHGAKGNAVECTGCGRIYPMREGIPVLLLGEASPPVKRPSEPPPKARE